LGLKEELRVVVEMQLPESVAKAATLAAIQEKLLEKSHKRHSKQYVIKPNIMSRKSKGKTGFSPTDMWKPRQLREHRRVNGLCFKCGEKFTPGHKCVVLPTEVNTAQLAAMEN
jgi:hypothetical protein